MGLFKRRKPLEPSRTPESTSWHRALCCTLEPDSPSLLRRLLGKVFSKVSFLDSQQRLLADLEQQGAVLVYAVKYRTELDFLLLNARLRQAGLRAPDTAFDLKLLLWLPAWRSIRLLFGRLRYYLREGRTPNPYQSGFFRERIMRRHSAVLFLVGEGGYYRRVGVAEEDPLHILIETQARMDAPVVLVPSLIFHGRAPERHQKGILDIFFGDKERPGRLRKLVALLRNYTRNVLEIAEPLNLKEWLASRESPGVGEPDLAFRLRREIIDRIDRHRRVVTGPIMKSRLEVKEIVLHNRSLQRHLARKVRSGERSLEAVTLEADRYLDEIAADYNMTYVQVWARFLNWIWTTIFDGIDLDEDSLGLVKQAAQQAPVVYVPCHKSHIDYLILSYLLYRNNLSTPYVAAGKNLAFWPLGPIFRKSGAFFIRRSFRGQRFYADVFATYIKTLVQEGYNIEFFIEGGRSRTGKLVLPKLGLLAILIQAVEEGYCNDLIFVPTAINYDRVLEEGAYLKEVKGIGKQKETLGQLVRARRVLKKRYGKVYVKFAPPISLKDHMKRINLNPGESSPKERHAMYRNFAWRVIHSINQASLVTPFALVSAAFLTTPKRGISLAEVKRLIAIYYDYLQDRGIPMAATLQDLERTVQDTLNLMEKSKWLEVLEDEEESDEEERIYTMEDGSRLQLEYYKNNMIHFLLPAAYVSTSILAKETFEFDVEGIERDLTIFRDFFKFEFVYDADEDLKKTIDRELSYFVSRGFISRASHSPGLYYISHRGLKALSAFASLLRNYFESYWIVLRGTKYLGTKPYGDRDFLKKINSLATRLYKQEVIERFESISRITFENAIKYYCEKGVFHRREETDNGKVHVTYHQTDNREPVISYSRLIDRYLRTSHFTFQ